MLRPLLCWPISKQTHDQLVQNEGIRYMKDNHETIVSTNVICSGLCRHNLCFGKGLWGKQGKHQWVSWFSFSWILIAHIHTSEPRTECEVSQLMDGWLKDDPSFQMMWLSQLVVLLEFSFYATTLRYWDSKIHVCFYVMTPNK